MTAYVIPESNMGELRERIGRLNTVCEKLALSAISFSVASDEVRTTGTDGEYMRWYTVEVVGESPVIGGWRFVAQIEHGESGNIIRNLGNVELPVHYRQSAPSCDHCQLARNRNNTYILAGEMGEYKQVGSSCLRDFTGHADPHAIAAYLEALAEIGEGLGESEYEGGRGHSLIASLHFLAIVACIIREDGWLGRTKALESGGVSTCDKALDAMLDKGQSPRKPTSDDQALAKIALEWGRNQTGESEYESNLRAVCGDYCNWRNLGLLASVIVAYRKATTKADENRKAAETSEYVGEVGAKITLPVKVIRVIETEGHYGLTSIITMNSNGNSLVWFASGQSKLDEGKEYQIKGTVKGHGLYNGVKQTTLTRCKVI